MLSSTLLPLCFSYSVTALRSDTSSSWTNPCENHMLAVVAAALAMWGAARRWVARRAIEPRSIERLVRWAITVSSQDHERDEAPRFGIGYSATRTMSRAGTGA